MQTLTRLNRWDTFWQMTHYTHPINKPTCTLIRVFSSNKVLRALWPIKMEYSAIDLSRFVPLLVGLANYDPSRWTPHLTSLKSLQISAPRMYPTDGHILSSVFISTDRWSYCWLSNWVFTYSPLMHPYMEITCTTHPKTILHACLPYMGRKAKDLRVINSKSSL